MPTPYVSFNGNCAEAFRFYEAELGGKILFMQTYGESPMGKDMPPAAQKAIMHATISLAGSNMMGADSGPWAPYGGGMRDCSLSLNYTNVEDAQKAFAALSKGGQVRMPLEKTFWAEAFGMLVDQFGVAWMINCETKA